MSWLFGGNPAQVKFDEAIDNATSELLPSGSDETLLTSLQLSDQIRSKSVEASYALKSLRRRITHKNPNVQIQSLHILDVLLKNSGEAFLLAVGNGKDGWMAELEDICKSSNHDLRQTATKYLQNWALTFQSASTSSALSSSDLVHLYNRLKHTIEFPPASQTMTSSMITSLSAPEWVDSDICQRCRTPFTLTNRKHHCRNCGGVFCGDCSSKTMKLEHLGIDQEVRVCDGCYKKLSMPGGRSASVSRHPESSKAQTVNGFRSDAKKTQEDADFERAIAMSLADSQSSAPSHATAQSNSLPGVGYGYEARPSRPEQLPDNRAVPQPSKQLEEEDPDLAAAIRASLAEAQPHASTSAAIPSAPPKSSYSYTPQAQASVPSYELAISEFDALDSFSNAMRHPQIRPDDANELFTRADRHRGKMYRALDDAHAKSSMLSDLNQKLQRAVRLYDSLLERNVSRYNQPYQQASAQSYQPQYHPQYQPQYSQQHQPYSSNASLAQPANIEQSGAYQQNSQQGYYNPAQAGPASQAYQQYGNTSNYVTQPATQQHSNSVTQYGEMPSASAYAPQNVEGSYNYAENGVQANAAIGATQQDHEHMPAQQNQPDEQYYNSYPVGAPPEHSHVAVGPAYDAPAAAWPRSPTASYATQQPYAHNEPKQQHEQHTGGPIHAQSAPFQTEHEAPVSNPHAPPQSTKYDGQSHNPTETSGKFQGFYSAASFPTVPTLPVGGLPAVPQGEFTEPHAQQKEAVSPRKEEALIEF